MLEQKAKNMVETARSEGVGGVHRRLRDEAERRGHGKQTAFAGVGGLLGGLVGSFRGPLGAALGGLVGALFGALLGMDRDRGRPQLPRPRARHVPVPRRPAYVETVRAAREYADVEWRG